MRLQARDVQSRAWLQRLLYYMLDTKLHDYAYVFHYVDVVACGQPFAFIDELPVPAAVGIDTQTDHIKMLVYYPLVSRLSLKGQIALLQHEALHVLEGHITSYGARLQQEYGRHIAGLATDMAVNQLFDTKPLEDDGLPPVTIAQFGFPPKLSSEDYCKLLRDMMAGKSNSEDGNNNSNNVTPADEHADTDPQAGTAGKPGEPYTGKGEQRASEVFDFDHEDTIAADVATKSVVKNVEEVLKAHGQTLSRGRTSADYAEFIKASERVATVPWFHYLRMMETRQRRERVVPTRRRLSRRHPAHLGRIRRYGLDVAFVVDTSGSMGTEQLQLVDPELRGLHARGAHITVIHCDAEVAKVAVYSPFERLEQFHGRGGTDYSDAFLMLREQYPIPGMVVCYTDGYGGIEKYVRKVKSERGSQWYDDFTAHSPSVSPDGMETLWLIPEGCMKPDTFSSTISPWGRVTVVPCVADRQA